MLKKLIPPSNPEEAIKSRRNPCYGFAVIADIEEHKELMSLLVETRDDILKIIDPDRATKQHPIRSPLYIKQKFFHTAVFGMQPLLEERQYVEIFANKNGLLNCEAMDKMCDLLQTHLNEKKPYLEPLKCELLHHDGTILARFAYKASDTDEVPLLTLASELDSEKTLSAWDVSNRLRYMTVTVALCVVDINKMADKLETIQKQLELATRKLQELGRIDIDQFQFISSYNKRTLSLKHISMYASIAPNFINRV